MKGILLSTLGLATLTSVAQNPLLNPGFENWTTITYYEEPPPFATTNLQPFLALGVTNVKEFPGQTGSCAYLETLFDGSNFLVGALFLGDPSMGLEGGTPYTQTPDSVSLTMAYSIEPGDTAYAIFAFTGGTLVFPNYVFIEVTGANGAFHTETFDIPIFFGAPDSLMVILTSGNLLGTPVQGSWIKFDDVTMIGATQQIPNKGFDTWNALSSEEPDHWATTNLYTAISHATPSATETSDAHSGNSALSLETVTFNLFGSVDTFGFMANGNLLGQSEIGGSPITFQPDRLRFWYKYAPVGSDTALAMTSFYRYNAGSGQSDSLNGSGNIFLAPAASYTEVEYFFDWSGIPQIPDTLVVAFASSNFAKEGSYIGVGSVLKIDDVVVDNATAVADISNDQSLQFWPVPAIDVLTLSIRTHRSGIEGTVRLIDVLGRTVMAQAIAHTGSTADMTLDVSHLGAGVFVWEVELNGERYTGKVELM
jgi:hypothetical protein